MKAEISHQGFKAERRYSGVYLQQGSMITDRDWNALCDRLRERVDIANRVTAASGVPKSDGLLTNFVESDAANHVWSAEFASDGGLVVADGIVAEARPADTSKDFSYSNQRDLLDLPPLSGRTFLYADIWDQVVTAFDERDLLDPGLHGAHTCFVTRTLAQIKRYKDEHDEEGLCGLRLDPTKMPSKGTGRFKVALRQSSAGPDNCDPCAETVDVTQNVDNYLFRLEVHDVKYDDDGIPQSATLKWSSGNGAVQYDRPGDFDHSTLDPDFAYEFFSAPLETLAGIPAEGYGASPARGDLRHSNLSDAISSLDRIRQWDGYCSLDLANSKFVNGWDKGKDLATGLPADAHGGVSNNGAAFVINLENLQLEITLTGKDQAGNAIAVLAGDYWLALARTRAEEAERVRALSEVPLGIQHYYCVLGPCESDGKSFKEIKSADKRRLHFPALTCLQAGDVGFQPNCDSSLFKGENPTNVEEALRLLCDIQAEDVGYDNENCAYAKEQGADNVQKALDAFCKRLQPPYLVIRMSQGTGQESAPGRLLPCPVSVVVEDQNGVLVKGAEVIFSVKHSATDQVFKDAASANPGANQKTVTVETDGEGQAVAVWWVDGEAGCHGLKAELATAPQDSPAPVWFSAHVGGTRADLPKVVKTNWENDVQVPFDQFMRGLVVMFDRPMLTKMISTDSFIVTWELPLSLGKVIDIATNLSEFFTIQIVNGRVSQVDDQSTLFQPKLSLGVDKIKQLMDLVAALDPGFVGLRCRVRLVGRSVFSEDGKTRLDGFVPTRFNGSSKDLAFDEAGLGQVSDFESWFYIVDEVRRLRINLNVAPRDELMALPGITRDIADKIISGRPWRRFEDLASVSGIGAARLETLKQLTVLG